MFPFEIKCLDHVAIRVRDLKASIAWYEQVLGLKKYQLAKWGDYPIFMLSGETGIALFPAYQDEPIVPNTKNVKIDHFAFQVTRKNFDKAKKRYDYLEMEYTISDHHYFHSIYTKDPDGHTVELTTIVVDPKKFYR